MIIKISIDIKNKVRYDIMKNDKLYDIDSVELTESIGNLKLDLKRNNATYREIFEKLESIKEKYPNVRKLWEDEKYSKLSEEESKALLETINLYRYLLKIEQYEIFLLGGKECFGYLKKIKAV